MSNKGFRYLISLAVFLLLPHHCWGSNKALIAAKVKELNELNRLVLSTIKKPEQFNGKQIFVKVKILPSTGKKIKFRIEKISIDKIKPSAQDDHNIIYLQGKVKISDSNNYKVDLSHILPEATSTKIVKSDKPVITNKQQEKIKNEKTNITN